MKRLGILTGALVGGLLTAALTGLMFLGRQLFGLPLVPYELFNWFSRELPGDVVTFGIDLMIDTMLFLGVSVVDTAKTAERAMAIVMFVLGGALAGAVYFAIMRGRRIKPSLFSGLVMGAIFGLPSIAITVAADSSTTNLILYSAVLAALFLAWGAALGWVYRRLESFEAPAEAAVVEPAATEGGSEAEEVDEVERRSVEKIGRRRFLVQLGAVTATVTVVSAGLGAVLATSERRRQEEALAGTMAHKAEGGSESPFPNANDPVVPVPGTRPEYTPIKDHYQVFLETEPTIIDGATWILPITGLVDNPLMLTIDDIRNNYEPRHQYVTLTCISGRVGTGLISTTQWTGASAQDVLADAGLQDSARYLFITSGDGFYETVDLDLIANDPRIMFCYGWDGNALPTGHGYPLRIWIPDRYGMKQPKWITAIEVTDEYREGYWVERNWDEVARVKATSVVDTVAVDHIVDDGGQMRVPVGGIAYAGDRGISKVEVRVDGGPWQEAQLRAPLSETTWVIWRYEWPFEAGDHTFEVRCAEADGTPQIETAKAARPDGSSGIHVLETTL
ncbi:MAG: molybdopterin-dependent oxidoreductase [Chloroflexota bacterium]|nr:MAG: molybdopterin-dependent oxidoreductase [Chloroflexota bacterium]